MIEKNRRISFRTYMNILKKKPFQLIIGCSLICVPLLIVGVVTLIVHLTERDVPAVDIELLGSQGKKKTAVVTDIETQFNVTINGVHPTTISYTYVHDGKQVDFSSKVLEERRVEELQIGQEVDILELNGTSFIEGMEPYAFPTEVLTYLLIPFLFIGSSFLIYAFFVMKKDLDLYGSGTVAHGKIVYMMPVPGFHIGRIGRGVLVQYEYKDRRGNPQIEESVTLDMSITKRHRQGDLIPIFVSKEKGSHSCLIPRPDAIRNGWKVDFD